METKLFFISIGLLIYTVFLKRFLRTKKFDYQISLKKLISILFHVIFCSLTGLVIGMILSTLSNRPEMMSRFAIIFTCIGAGLGFIHYLTTGGNVEKQTRILRIDLDWADTSWSAILLASILMFFVIQAFKIPSGSMRMTLVEGDHLFVNKFIYGIHIPFSGRKRILPLKKIRHKDIIVFSCPPQALSRKEREKGIKKDFIKRTIALAGDTVEITDKKVYVNGKSVSESYTNFEDIRVFPKISLYNTQEEYQTSWEEGRFANLPVNLPVRDNFGPVKVPEGCYFVLGDNRDRSFDSRFWGPLSDKYLKGQALVVYWPITRIKVIK